MAAHKSNQMAALFTKEDLLKGAKQLGEPVEVVTAALYDVNEAISLEQAKKLIEDFKNRPVTNQ